MKTVTEAVDAVICHGTGAREVRAAAIRARDLQARYRDILAEVAENEYVIMLIAGLAGIGEDEESVRVVTGALGTAFMNGVMVGMELNKVDLEGVLGDGRTTGTDAGSGD